MLCDRVVSRSVNCWSISNESRPIMGGNPTLEAKIPIRFIDLVGKDIIAKATKTYALVNVNVEDAKDLQD